MSTIWDLLKNSYSNEGQSPTEKDAMVELIDNYLMNEEDQNVASFQDYSQKEIQTFNRNK